MDEMDSPSRPQVQYSYSSEATTYLARRFQTSTEEGIELDGKVRDFLNCLSGLGDYSTAT